MVCGELPWNSICFFPGARSSFVGTGITVILTAFKLAVTGLGVSFEQMLAGVGEKTFAYLSELGHAVVLHLLACKALMVVGRIPCVFRAFVRIA